MEEKTARQALVERPILLPPCWDANGICDLSEDRTHLPCPAPVETLSFNGPRLGSLQVGAQWDLNLQNTNRKGYGL